MALDSVTQYAFVHLAAFLLGSNYKTPSIVPDRLQQYNNPMTTQFINDLETRRKSCDMSVSELCRRAEVGRPFYHRLVAGTARPGLRTAEKLANVLGMRIEWPVIWASPTDSDGDG